jgi:hypothetical protein
MNNKAADPGTPAGEIQHQSDKTAVQASSGSNTDTTRQCPDCRVGLLVFDGCLNLTCSLCGYTDTGGGFT